MPARDTIFAVSSAPGRAAIAVVRVSGPEAGAAIEALTRRPVPEARRAVVRALYSTNDPNCHPRPSAAPAARGEGDPGADETAVLQGPRGADSLIESLSPAPGSPSLARAQTARVLAGDDSTAAIDHALILFLPSPASATGEDVAEFHIHGGRAVTHAVLDALAALPGLRPAERGEFTRRAVENGRLDLTQAEGLADLIDAETDAQRAQALEQYGGALLQRCDDWRARLVRISAWAEASIDFSDEELDPALDARVKSETEALLEDIRTALAGARRGEVIRDGFHLAVIGPPNAGKSSLVNALAQRDVAIVSEIPGTTRDVLEARLDLDGYLVTVADTAGLREAGEAIEAEGVRRALARADAADLVLLVLDGSADEPALPKSLTVSNPQLSWPGRAQRGPGHPVSAGDEQPGWPAFAGHDSEGEMATNRVLVVWNKLDLPFPVPRDGLKISVATGEGLDALREALSARVRGALESRTGDAPVIARLRHRVALEEAAASLARALESDAPELAAENLRLALRAIGRVTGRVDVEDLLDVIFRDFCIGK